MVEFVINAKFVVLWFIDLFLDIVQIF